MDVLKLIAFLTTMIEPWQNSSNNKNPKIEFKFSPLKGEFYL